MADRIRITSSETLHQGWARLRRVTLDYQRDDGSWQTLNREVFDHGHAAAVLLFNPARQSVVLVRQLRIPAHLSGDDGWMIETCAGLLEGDTPEDCARREALEETGYRVTKLTPAFRAYSSPGSLTEILHCFVGEYDDASRVEAGGGLNQEGEDIELLEMGLDEALGLIATGEIMDLKTIALLQHLALRDKGR